MNELEELRRDTQAIFCPCNKPDCPFTAENRKSSSPTVSSTCLKLRSISLTPRTRKPSTYNGFTRVREDCEVDQEGTLSCNDYTFRRSGPSRRGLRRTHTSLTQSLSLTSGSHMYLKPPQPPLSPNNLSERSTSLPSISCNHPVRAVNAAMNLDSRGIIPKSLHLSHSRLIMPSAWPSLIYCYNFYVIFDCHICVAVFVLWSWYYFMH